MCEECCWVLSIFTLTTAAFRKFRNSLLEWRTFVNFITDGFQNAQLTYATLLKVFPKPVTCNFSSKSWFGNVSNIHIAAGYNSWSSLSNNTIGNLRFLTSDNQKRCKLIMTCEWTSKSYHASYGLTLWIVKGIDKYHSAGCTTSKITAFNDHN